jgi:3-hydroxyisobutyrate dehydrogenase
MAVTENAKNQTVAKDAAALPKKVAFLGMGIMGAAMAANLAPHASLSVWNRSTGRPGLALAEAAGATVCAHLKDCLAEARVIFACLGDEHDVETVLTGPGGVSELAGQGAMVVDFSTIGPKAARHINEKLAAAGLKFLDAPVTGGDVGAREGTLTIMVGGERSVFEEVTPYLAPLGKTIKYCGKSGSGQALKLANQTLCAVNLIGVCEAMKMAQELGLDHKLVVEVLEGGAGGSWSLSNLGRRIVKDDYTPGFGMQHMLKDLRLAFENLSSHGAYPGTELALSMFQQSLAAAAEEAGLSESDPDKVAVELNLGTQAMIKAYQQQGETDRIALEWQLDGEIPDSFQ